MPYTNTTKLGRMKNKIDAFIRRIERKTSQLNHPALVGKPGKLYEYCVVERILEEMVSRGWKIRWSGGRLVLKGAPGMIGPSEPHFAIIDPFSNEEKFRLYVSIEVRTIGSSHSNCSDLSGMHEVDVGIFKHDATVNPNYDQLYLAAECKCVSSFSKNSIRSIIGLRHQLSIYCCIDSNESKLFLDGDSRIRSAFFYPASEFYLFSVDSRILNYTQAPANCGISLKHYEP